MRRVKPSGKIVKTISFAAAVAALSTGSLLSVEAAQGESIVVQNGDTYTNITASDLSNPTYVNQLRDAFLAGDKMFLVTDSATGEAIEFSASARGTDEIGAPSQGSGLFNETSIYLPNSYFE